MRAPLIRLATGAAAGLTLAACTAAVGGTGTPPPVERALAIAPDAQDADLVSGLTVAPDGTVLVTTVGPAGRAGVHVVDVSGGGATEVDGALRLEGTQPDAVLTAEGETYVVGLVGESSDGEYSVIRVDPATGEVAETREIAGTQHAGEVDAAVLPDGIVAVIGDRTDGPPFLLLDDPVHGTPQHSARIDVSAVAGEGDRVQLSGLAVSADGAWIAVALTVRPADGSEATAALAVVEVADVGRFPTVGDTVALDGPRVSALAVGDDGTAYVAQEGESGVSAVDAGVAAVHPVPADLGEVTGLAVLDGALVAVDRGLLVTRLDPADGAVTRTVDLCADTGAASGIGVVPDGSLVVAANCGGAGLWVLPA